MNIFDVCIPTMNVSYFVHNAMLFSPNYRFESTCFNLSSLYFIRIIQFAFQSYFAHQLEHRRVRSTVTETDMNILICNLNAYIEEQYIHIYAEGVSNPYKCSICNVERNSQFEILRHVRERYVYKTLPKPIKPNMKERYTCNI